ncbi:glycosyltransferase involved in cell wall biosynthesis [Oxalobacteraceae bacterium GrIS 1.18]
MPRNARLRYFLGELFGYTLIYSGVARWFLSRRLARGEITAFYLHDPKKEIFEKLMLQARKWGFEFINDQQLIDHLDGKLISNKPLLHISVDDGWKRNLTNVADFAESNGIPISYFISTEPLVSGQFWWANLKEGSTVERMMTVPNHERIKFLDARPVDETADFVRDALTRDQLRALSEMSHATIGNHSHTHPMLANCSDCEVEFEIKEAHDQLAGITNKKITSFAYPSGSVNTHAQAVLKSLGYAIAYFVEPRGILPNEPNRYEIPRFSDNLRGGYAENFCRLIGLWQSKYNIFGKKLLLTYKGTDAVHVTPSRLIKLIQFIPEPNTTFRVDVVSLFGKYLPRNGVDCRLIGSVANGAVGQTGKLQAMKNRISRELVYWKTLVSTLSTADKTNCDLIQVRDQVFVGLISLCAARLKGIPFCYWMSFVMAEARIEIASEKLKQSFSLRQCLVLTKGLLEKFVLYKILLPNVSHVFVQSDAMSLHVQKEGVPAEKITAVPMGVDTEKFVAQDLSGERPQRWGSAPVIAYLGTLTKSRKIETLIDAFELVKQTVPDALLVLIGASDSRQDDEEILGYARKKGLANSFELTGWLPSDQALKLLVRSDVAVSFIPRNQMYDLSSPTKLLEYLAAGIPCVANDSPDQVHVLEHSRAGWLVNSTIPAMADALIEILQDPAAARQRSSAGPEYIEANRSYRVLAEMVARQYRKLIQPAVGAWRE